MNTVQVLIDGYAKKISNGWLASSSTVLIRNKNIKIIVDPGANRKLLIKNLNKEGLKPSDINIVYLTHYHIDHSLLMGIFENAVVMDGETIYKGDTELEYQNHIPDTEVKIVFTPGHDEFHSSLIIELTSGKYAVAGDIFWWTNEEKQLTDYRNLIKHKDPFTKNKKALIASREKILKFADWIIPGHGKIFKSPLSKK